MRLCPSLYRKECRIVGLCPWLYSSQKGLRQDRHITESSLFWAVQEDRQMRTQEQSSMEGSVLDCTDGRTGEGIQIF